MPSRLELARQQARAQALRNAQVATGASGLRSEELSRHARNWWDIPAKIAVGNRIAAEEKARAVRHHNDRGDALRHARWSRRMAEATGPVFATVAGVEHEWENLMDHQPLSESVMDMINNTEGVASAREHRPIDIRALQDQPIPPRGATWNGGNLY